MSFQVNAGQRWALVGPNGAGKTTLLRILMGQETPDEGNVSFAKDIRVGYLEQEFSLDEHTSALEEVVNSATEVQRLSALIQQQEAMLSDMHAHDGKLPSEDQDALLQAYGENQNRFEQLGGYELEARAKQILGGLGFHADDYDKRAHDFSGGWQMRISLAKLLLKHPDLLLLDEPTNHLDLESVRWLESFLASYSGCVLIVSHDRAFMDACASHIASIENKRLMTYTGNYSSYLKQREDNLAQLSAKREKQLQDIQHLETFIERFRYKPTKAKQVQERIRRLESIKKDLVVLPQVTKSVHFHFPAPERTGDMVVTTTHLSKSYADHTVWNDTNISLYRGDKVALVGANGAGKSTLLKLICGKEQATSGTIDFGAHVEVSYYAQHQLDALNESHTVLQELIDANPLWTTTQLRALLGAFLFHGDDVEKKVGVLSGGERARLALSKMLVCPRPLLLLDEPTNHLDIDSVEILEEALKSFPGTIMIVTHDEHLVRSVATKVIEVKDGAVRTFDGDYEYYLYKRAELDNLEVTSNASATHAQMVAELPHTDISSRPSARNTKTKEQRRLEAEERNRKNKMFAKERGRLKEVEQLVTKHTARKEELEALLADSDVYQDTERFNDVMGEYTEVSRALEALEDEWLRLTEILEA